MQLISLRRRLANDTKPDLCSRFELICGFVLLPTVISFPIFAQMSSLAYQYLVQLLQKGKLMLLLQILNEHTQLEGLLFSLFSLFLFFLSPSSQVKVLVLKLLCG